MAGAKVKKVEEWSLSTKASYFREIKRIKKSGVNDWFLKFKEETKNEVNEDDPFNDENDLILSWIFEDENRRKQFIADKENRPTRSKKNSVENEDDSTTIENLIQKITDPREIEKLERLLKIKKEEIIEEVEKQQMIDQLMSMNAAELKRLMESKPNI